MALITSGLAILNAIGFILAVWAFRAKMPVISLPTQWFVRGFQLIYLTQVLRNIYWDVAMPGLRLMAPDTAAAWSELTNGRVVNIIFGLMMSGSIYCMLKCRQALIPDEERAQWPWYRAWMHPTRIRLLPWSQPK